MRSVGLGVRLGVGVGPGVGSGVGVGRGRGMLGTPFPVHVHVLVSAFLRPVRHMTVKLFLEEVVPPLVGVIALLDLVSLGKEVLQEGMLVGIDFLLLDQILQPFLVVFLLE